MAPKSRGSSGGLSRRAAVALLGGGSLLGLSGTGAFSQVDGNKPFSVATAGDANALLRIEGLKDGETYKEPHEVTITNKFEYKLNNNTVSTDSESLKLKSSEDDSPSNEIQVSSLDPDEDDSFFIITESEQKKQGTVSVTYSGTGGEIEVSRDITIEAETDDPNECSGMPVEVSGKKENVDTTRTVEVRNKGEVVNNVIADGCVLLFNTAVVKGFVDSGGKVHLRNQSEIKEHVVAEGDVILEQRADIKSTVDSKGSVTLKNNATITGNVKAEGDITILNNAEIKGDATAGGEVRRS